MSIARVGLRWRGDGLILGQTLRWFREVLDRRLQFDTFLLQGSTQFV